MNVFGIEYKTLAQVTARLAQLSYTDSLYGQSDDRVTERNEIIAALDALTGSPEATQQLFANAVWLYEHSAPILPLDIEADVVKWNITLKHATQN